MMFLKKFMKSVLFFLKQHERHLESDKKSVLEFFVLKILVNENFFLGFL